MIRPLVGLFGVVAGGLAILAWLILGLGIAEPWVPDPENVCESFIGKLSAGHYEAAQSELSSELQTRFSVPELEKLDRQLKDRFGNYAFKLGGQSREEGDKAEYDALVKTERQGTLTAHLELQQDQSTHEWKISSVQALAAAAQ